MNPEDESLLSRHGHRPSSRKWTMSEHKPSAEDVETAILQIAPTGEPRVPLTAEQLADLVRVLASIRDAERARVAATVATKREAAHVRAEEWPQDELMRAYHQGRRDAFDALLVDIERGEHAKEPM